LLPLLLAKLQNELSIARVPLVADTVVAATSAAPAAVARALSVNLHPLLVVA
jgi:hypothetical protein